MRFLHSASLVGGVVFVLGVCPGGLGAQAPTPAAGTPATKAVPPTMHRPDEFVGVWDYNPDESINVATGRPEQSPSRRKGGAVSVPGGTDSPMGPQPGAGGTGGGTGGVIGGGNNGLPPPGPDPTLGIMMGGVNDLASGVGTGRDRAIGVVMPSPGRDLRRDLLEVAERFTISVTHDAVTFVDDLNRALTFPTNGRKHHYQIGAATFDAKTSWQGPQLIQSVTGGDFFKMTTTYFLNADGTRLFVVIRVGEPVKGRLPEGFNRVYDRVDSAPGRR